MTFVYLTLGGGRLAPQVKALVRLWPYKSFQPWPAAQANAFCVFAAAAVPFCAAECRLRRVFRQPQAKEMAQGCRRPSSAGAFGPDSTLAVMALTHRPNTCCMHKHNRNYIKKQK